LVSCSNEYGCRTGPGRLSAQGDPGSAAARTERPTTHRSQYIDTID